MEVVVVSSRPNWQPRVIRRFIKNFPTATEVVLVETDQGTGYLKALGNKSGSHALACEWVGTNLAKLLGLQTLEFSIIDIASDDEIPLTSGMRASPGPAFITRAEKGNPWGGKEGELDKLANPEDIGRLVLFDTWVVNCDRYPPDLTASMVDRLDKKPSSRRPHTRQKDIVPVLQVVARLACTWPILRLSGTIGSMGYFRNLKGF